MNPSFAPAIHCNRSTLSLLLAWIIAFTTQATAATDEDLLHWAHYKEDTQSLSAADLRALVDTPRECFVVAHTHWDKEWGFTFEQHRYLLVKLLDNTIAMLEQEPRYTCYVLDGQSSLVTDYLDVRPEMQERLKNLVKAKRLLIGPWYTQPDLLVASGEEIVRNLLLGIQTARRFGGEMQFGYTADNFGYCSQIPQIYRGFGIDAASLYRGPDASGPKHKTLFEWQALDESSVTVAYTNGPSGYLLFTWPYNVPDMPEAYFLRALHHLLPHAIDPTKILLPAGSDAVEPNPDLPEVLARLSDEFPHMTFQICAPKTYVQAVMKDTPTLPKHQGGLREKNACTGSISARLNLKQANAKAFTTLEHFAEPFSTLAWLTAGRPYPDTLLRESWKYLFENLTHDDMAGFCYEPVHAINEMRYFESNRLAETLTLSALKTLVEDIQTPDKDNVLSKPLIVFNPLPWTRSDIVETFLHTQSYGGTQNPFVDEEYTSFKITQLDGSPCPYSVRTASASSTPMFRLRFHADNVPPLGYKTFLAVATREESPHIDSPKPAVTEIENRFYKLSFQHDGRFDLLDKSSGILYPGLHYFQDQDTPGGRPLYFHIGNNTHTTIEEAASITLIEDNATEKTIRIQWEDWQIPANKEDAASVPMPITSYITLPTNVARIDIITEVHNQAHNHLLRAVFPTVYQSEHIALGVQFGMENAPLYTNDAPPKNPWNHELYPFQDWCDLSDSKQGLALLCREIPVISAYPTATGTTLMLPILRACAPNSPDLRISLPDERLTPQETKHGAQQLGRHVVHYSLYPHTGDWESARVYQKAKNAHCRLWPETYWKTDRAKWQIGPYGFPKHHTPPKGTQPPEKSFLNITPDGAILSTLKKAENDDAILLRIFNTLPHPQTYTLNFFHPTHHIQQVNLLEEPLEKTSITQTSSSEGETHITCTTRPFEIITLKLAVIPPPVRSWRQSTY